MRAVAALFAALEAVSVVWAVVAALCMGAWLSRHGVRVHWILFRGLMPWYVHRYHNMTKEIDGHSGPLFMHLVVPINLALLFTVAAMIAAVAGRV